MRKRLTGILLGLFITSASLADVIIDGFPIQSTALQSITIDPVSGNVIITSNVNHQISVTVTTVGTGVGINFFNLTPTSVAVGGTTTVEWSVSNATSCTASGGTGDWGGNVNASGDSMPVNVGNVVGSFSFFLSCNDGGTPVTAEAVLEVTSEPVVAITSFVASPSSIETGNSVNISWSISNATSCEATGGTGGWAGSSISLPTGNKVVQISNSGNYQFGMTCTGGGTSTSKSTNIVVVTDPTTTGCDPINVGLQGRTIGWTSLFNTSWAQTGSSQKLVAIQKGEYVAIQFNSSDILATGYDTTIETTANSGIRLGTISRCPGQFYVLPDECKESWGIDDQLNWSTLSNPGSACSLEPNTTYYLNLTFTDGYFPSSDTCMTTNPSSSTCYTYLKHIKF
jgi:hypothetical protein